MNNKIKNGLLALLIAMPAGNLLSISKHSYDLSDTTRYSESSGHGYDVLPSPGKHNVQPFYYSIQVPDGNYKITVKLGSKKRAGITTVRAESRRLYIQSFKTAKGEFSEHSFIVNKRTAKIDEKESVKLKTRELSTFTWDDKITLEFNGEIPSCASISIEKASDDIPTIFLCGNSTVVDQAYEPWASWGQMIPYFFDDKVCVANYAESGESAGSFLSANRLKKALSQMKAGDYFFIEFGHNDQKYARSGSGAYYIFMYNLKIFIDEIKAKGGNPVLVTPTRRRRFDENGKNINSHGEFPDAIHFIATKENIPLIDLNEKTRILVDALGEEESAKAYVHYKAGTFPGQDKELADNSHFSTYGANQVAQCVLTGIQEILPSLAAHLKPGFHFNPSKPVPFNTFKWDIAPAFETLKPDGN